ncbi:MAG TPA: type I glyceraldehyde-3-phosphate dehydrogenase [Dehalococcoidia bacterium]|nr:type I glyceraldehyde-3-phosphate dehydrogenase [Dehalococcoidia bacterium]
MATRIGINGFGRIGRQVLKAIGERHPGELEVVALNDLVDTETNAHLLKYDSNYGHFHGTVEAKDDALIVNGNKIAVTKHSDPGQIPWRDFGVDLVVESTGVFTDATKACAHISGGGAKKVIISAPAKNEDVTLVLGVNDERYDPAKHNVISNASCTTNGLAPVVKVLLDNFGIVKGQMTTVHSYTNSQKILDLASKDLREARAGALNIVPTSTGAAKALRLVVPEVAGKIDGLSYRVPTPTVSIVEVVALTEKNTSVDEVNAAICRAAEGRMKGILGLTMEPVVSMDMKGDERSSIVDGLSTNVVVDNLVKVAAWYDNEWGYSCRVADLCAFVAGKGF